MDRGTRWAADIAKGIGAMAWGVGLLLHVQAIAVLAWIIEALTRGWGLGSSITTWHGILAGVLVFVSGPVAVAVGGGLRFIGGMLAGQKVAGVRVARIALFAWLRYELLALGLALIMGGFLALLDFAPTNSNWDIGLTLCLVTIFVTTGFFCVSQSSQCRRKAEKLMQQTRAEGLRRGMVPYPADAVPSSRRFEGGRWKDKPGSGPPGR